MNPLTFTSYHLRDSDRQDTYTITSHPTTLAYAHRFATYDSRIHSGLEIVRFHPADTEEATEAFFTMAGKPFDITGVRDDQIAPSRLTVQTLWHDIATLITQHPETPVYVTPATYFVRGPDGSERTAAISSYVAVEAALNVADSLGDRPILITDSRMMNHGGGIRQEPLNGNDWHEDERLHASTRVHIPATDCPDRVLAVARNRREDAHQEARRNLRAVPVG